MNDRLCNAICYEPEGEWAEPKRVKTVVFSPGSVSNPYIWVRFNIVANISFFGLHCT